ncbi:MAG TPA: hypothetical protein VGB95_03765, partial [Chitinophagales bacterium]
SKIQYGYNLTWYLSHPALTVLIGSWLSFFNPTVSYWLFQIFQISLMALAAFVIAKQTDDKLHKTLAFFFLLCSFVTYWMLYVGNPQSFMVLSIALILSSLYQFAFAENANQKTAERLLLAGLLISLFSKPIVLIMLPVLLLNKKTRKTTVFSILIYAVVSAIFVFVPVLNPEHISFDKLVFVATHPAFAKENLNIYKNQYVLNAFMKDNSIHWINLVAQSDHYLNHIQIFALSVFVNTMAGEELSPFIFKFPMLLSLVFSGAMLLLKNENERLQYSFLVVCSIVFTFFLSYNTVWEYQFTAALPVVAFMPILMKVKPDWKNELKWVFFAGFFFCLPSFYFLLSGSDIDNTAMELIRFNRVVPAVVAYAMFALLVGKRLYKALDE